MLHFLHPRSRVLWEQNSSKKRPKDTSVIPKFAELAKPLMDLSTLHPSQFKWNQIHQKAFESMIDAIQANTSLNLPDPSKPFFVQTDASDVAGAGRVFQKDDQGNELLMACVSRTFTHWETN